MKKLSIVLGAVMVLAAGVPSASALTPEQDAQLQQLADQKLGELFGAMPSNYQGYRGDTQGPQPLPPGCRQVSRPDAATGRTWVVVDCNPGHTWTPNPPRQ